MRLFLKPPGWQPAELGGFVPPPDVDRASYRRFDTPPLTRGRALYVFLHFAVILAASAALLHARGCPSPCWLRGPPSCS